MERLLDWSFIVGHINYWLFIVLMMTGLFIVVARGNLLKKIVGLNIFQTSVFMLYISIGKVTGGTAPIYSVDRKGYVNADPDIVYSNPLPHVLILTAIVVGIATTSLGLALIVRIREAYDTIEEDEILKIESELSEQDNRKYGSAMGGRA
jgi:multicomponent Na+:H+ antiporter subunit C